ncbi:MAG: succinate dehydrogenase, hydrophobic membrane anchor protein [Gammaproteobacteria bacterium RIFCSPHIGHO2_12_FULL_35_23]|nr:MAG: succinate dehydrogenase, hydrophobic membrane anchor protein [Gammaproteobacteria bacterium RIFCSPHIGHO2_12_FULL_35_23]
MSTNTKGLRDWIIQRVSAIYLGLYATFLFVYLIVHPDLTYQVWQNLFTLFWFRVASILLFGCLVLHTWIGLWTVITDYIKLPIIRMIVQLLIIFSLIIFFIWGIEIVWGIPLTWI